MMNVSFILINHLQFMKAVTHLPTLVAFFRRTMLRAYMLVGKCSAPFFTWLTDLHNGQVTQATADA